MKFLTIYKICYNHLNFIEETFKACKMQDPSLIKYISNENNELLNELIKYGINFFKENNECVDKGLLVWKSHTKYYYLKFYEAYADTTDTELTKCFGLKVTMSEINKNNSRKYPNSLLVIL